MKWPKPGRYIAQASHGSGASPAVMPIARQQLQPFPQLRRIHNSPVIGFDEHMHALDQVDVRAGGLGRDAASAHGRADEELVEGGIELGPVGDDEHALACGEAIRLEHHRKADAARSIGGFGGSILGSSGVRRVSSAASSRLR